MRRSLALLATAVVAASFLSGCGSDDSAGSSSDAGTLRVGYQRFGGLSLIKAPTATHRTSDSHQGSCIVLITGSVRITPGMVSGSNTISGMLSVYPNCAAWIDSDTTT